MGRFIFNIDATGGHGAHREIKHHEELKDCGSEFCIDCILHRTVNKLRSLGVDIHEAKLVNWPNAYEWDGKTIVDDFKRGIRHGSF